MSRTGENIYKRKDGRYEARYIASRDENGKAKYASVYGHTKAEARELLKKAKGEVAGEDFYTNRIFSEVAPLWLLEEGKKLADTTIDRYRTTLELYIIPYIGDTVIRDISDDEIRNMLSEVMTYSADRGRLGGRLKGNSIARVQEIAMRVVKFANDRDFPKKRIDIPKPDKGRFLPLAFEEQKAVCSLAMKNKSPEMLAVLMMLFTGIRLGELCALSCDDIDLERMEIYIHQSVHRIRAKDSNGKKTENVIAEIPTKAHIRMECFPKELAQYIREYYLPGTILLTGKKDVPMEARTLRNRIDRVLAESNVEAFAFQRFRKTWVEGKADASLLGENKDKKDRIIPYEDQLDMAWLKEEMKRDLKALRLLLGLSIEEMGDYIGVSESTYRKMEDMKRDIAWNEYLAFLFLFYYNVRTEGVVEFLGLYPKALKEEIKV